MMTVPSGNSGATPGTRASSSLPSCSRSPSARIRPITGSAFSGGSSKGPMLLPAVSFIAVLAIIPVSASEPRSPRAFGSFCGWKSVSARSSAWPAKTSASTF